jgi:hypothetical protein
MGGNRPVSAPTYSVVEVETGIADELAGKRLFEGVSSLEASDPDYLNKLMGKLAENPDAPINELTRTFLGLQQQVFELSNRQRQQDAEIRAREDYLAKKQTGELELEQMQQQAKRQEEFQSGYSKLSPLGQQWYQQYLDKRVIDAYGKKQREATFDDHEDSLLDALQSEKDWLETEDLVTKEGVPLEVIDSRTPEEKKTKPFQLDRQGLLAFRSKKLAEAAEREEKEKRFKLITDYLGTLLKSSPTGSEQNLDKAIQERYRELKNEQENLFGQLSGKTLPSKGKHAPQGSGGTAPPPNARKRFDPFGQPSAE